MSYIHRNQWENGKLLKWAVGRNRKKHFSFHLYSSASCSKNARKTCRKSPVGLSDQERHGSCWALLGPSEVKTGCLETKQ